MSVGEELINRLVSKNVKVVYKDKTEKAIKGTLMGVSDFFIAIRGEKDENVVLINKSSIISIKEI